MKPEKPAITGTIDKDQLDYESNFNPDSVSYVGPRVITNHAVISSSASAADIETTH